MLVYRLLCSALCLAVALLPAVAAAAEDQPQGPPPMLVSVSPVETGTAQPMIELVGTVRYLRTAEVAGEMSGIVQQIYFEEGERLPAATPLLQLNTDLLQTDIAATRGSYQQVLVELERARKDFARSEALFREDSLAEIVYDENRYRVLALEEQAATLKATLDRRLLELEKTTITTPFEGLVVAKLTEKGEWLNAGTPVALLADDRSLEIDVAVPQQLLGYLQPGQTLDIRSNGNTFTGRFSHFVPRGDVATRTFSVKLRLENRYRLAEGMEAHVRLPAGERISGLLVPRDAVIKQFGEDILFLAADGTAKLVPVTVRGFHDMQVAVAGEGLAAGQQVVVKGNERIRDGQAIRLQ